MWHEERCLSTGNHDPEIELCLSVCHRIESFEILDQETCSHQVLITRISSVLDFLTRCRLALRLIASWQSTPGQIGFDDYFRASAASTSEMPNVAMIGGVGSLPSKVSCTVSRPLVVPTTAGRTR